MVSTRANNNTQVKRKDITKNLSQSINKTPKTQNVSGKCIRPSPETPGPSSSPKSKNYICSICRNTESIRNASLESSTDSLVSKLNSANEAFSDSMSKVESLSLSLRHFIVSNSDDSESNQSALSNMQQSLNDLTDRSQMLHDQILKNEVMLKTLAASINDYKNSTHTPTPPEGSEHGHTGNTCQDLPVSKNSRGHYVIQKLPPLLENPTTCTTNIVEDFLPAELRSTVCSYLENFKDFTNRGKRKVVTFGHSFKNIGRKSDPASSIPSPFSTIIDDIHKKFNVSPENMLNFVEISKFHGPDAKMTSSERPDASISPDSHIFTISLGDSCTIKFKDSCTNNEHSVDISDNCMYSMSSKSQHYWSHKIEHPVLSEASVRYSVIFKSMRRNNKNSTLIIGDSNTHKVYFNHEEGRRSDLGKEIHGKRITAYTIKDIQPTDAIGFQNVVIQVGLNNMKDRYTSDDGLIDIEGTFIQWLKKIQCIKQLCPYSRVIVAPIPPTKIRILNNRAKQFNAILLGA